MRVLFDGTWFVHYGQLYVESASGSQLEDMDAHFRGQRNGLLGAAVPGALFLITGLHTGDVGLRVERHDEAPDLDPAADDVAEAGLTVSTPVALVGWGGESSEELDVGSGSYRVRWSTFDIDAGQEQDTSEEDGAVVDRYLLQLWPGSGSGDLVLRATSQTAAYWNDWASGRR